MGKGKMRAEILMSPEAITDSPQPHIGLRAWQWVFGVGAPVTLIGLDLALFNGWLVQVAPATLWTLAIVGPALLILSQWRGCEPLGVMLTGALCVAGLLAVLVAVTPTLLAMAVAIPFAALMALISSFFLWPLALCVLAIRRQVRLRNGSWRLLRSPAAFAGGAALIALLALAEIGDRLAFGFITNRVGSTDADVAVDGLKALAIYPLGLMAREQAACEAFYGQAPDSFLDPADFDPAMRIKYGARTDDVLAAARGVFGPRPAARCKALLENWSEEDFD